MRMPVAERTQLQAIVSFEVETERSALAGMFIRILTYDDSIPFIKNAEETIE